MKIKKILYNTFFVLLTINTFAQEGALNKAEKDYTSYAYIDAISTYEKVAEKGYQDETMFQRLGNAYYFNGELIKAAKWYDALFAMKEQQEPEYYYRYAQTLKAVKNYEKADQILETFNKLTQTDKRGLLFKENKNYLEQIKLNSGRFEIIDAGINSRYSDYGSAFLNNKVVFASARDTGAVVKNTFKWTNRSFTNLYAAEINEDGTIGKPERFDRKINSKFNESTPVFTKDGKTMYFTRNNYLEGKRGRDDKKITLLKLYRAQLVNDKWTDLTELPFNSDQYSVAHPALSIDEKILYFASDMPGTLGQSDLFSVSINADGSFGTPQNLGIGINTEGRETFPFIAADNDLYFATDGRPGLGGLDVFVSKINANNTFGEVQNIGAPINTEEDDFAFILDKESRTGFFSSNRKGGNGYDDIYRFTEKTKLVCEQILIGKVVDQNTNAILVNAKLNLFNSKLEPIAELISGADGSFTFAVNCGDSYYVRAAKDEYETKEIPVSIVNTTGETNITVALEKRIKAIVVGADLSKELDIPIIYFDLDKSFITKAAAFELEKILAVMNNYPKMKIDVRSHTDSRQTEKYNLALSDRRAKSTIQWLVAKGINKNRIIGRGYGESQLVNKCSDDEICSEADHQLNRRSEFIVISID